ncbi:1-deoxy-D-xylulose-5-phosphate synthase, partial [[Clostridium] symbiosum]
NNASHLEKDFIVVLNDNQMSISQNVGGMSRYLDGIRTADAYTNLKKGLEKAIRKIPSGGDQILSHLRKT